MVFLLRSVRIFSPGTPDHEKKKDLLIDNGIITAIADRLDTDVATEYTIEDKNLCVSPGWFDLHVDFGEPGYEHKEDLSTGANAAMQGGFTGVLAMPSTNPPLHSKSEIEFIRTRSAGKLVDIHPAGCITVNQSGKDLAELYDMSLSGALAFTDDKHALLNSGVLLRALLYSKNFGGKIMLFPDDPDLSSKGQMNEGVVSTRLGLKGIPALAESSYISRAIQIAEYADAPVHFSTISTEASVQIIRDARKRGLKITADVAAYNLLLDDTSLDSFDSNCKVKPPLRTRHDIEALKHGLKDGTISFVTSDHRPQDIESKQKEFDLADFGMAGLETAFGVIRTALGSEFTTGQLVDFLAIQPRILLGLEIPKVMKGQKANLTLFAPDEEWTVTRESLQSRSCNTPFIGHKLTGRPKAVFNNNLFYQIPSLIA